MKNKSKIIRLVVAMIFIIAIPMMFVGCNYQVFDTNYTFTNAYVKIGDEWQDLEITSWKDYEGEQIQIKLTNGTVMVISSVNCILYNGEFPL